MGMAQTNFGSLAVFGGGVMGSAIVRGGIAAGVLEPSRVIVCEPDSSRREHLARLGVRTTAGHPEALEFIQDWGTVLLAVKPQSLDELAAQLRGGLAQGERLVISVMAGIPGTQLRARLGARLRIVRAMPNTAAAERLSMTAIAAGPGATGDDLSQAEAIFAAIGETVRIDEAMMDAATAVVGSGPAYVYLLAEAMMRGARDVGFDEPTADAMVRGTIRGAAAMLARNLSLPPAELRARVTSKGGTTAAAIQVLEQAGFVEAQSRAIVAARDRGRQLAQIHSADHR